MRSFSALTAIFLFFPAATAGETLVDLGSPMRYLSNRADPGIGLDWVQPGFDDAGWSPGTYGVGYDKGDEAANLLATPLTGKWSSIYTRTTFTVDDPGKVRSLSLGADYDDGYVAWVNGVEVYRSPQMASTGPAWDTSADDHEASDRTAPFYETMNDISALALPALVPGVNVLAIGVWNVDPSSTDLILVPRLVRDYDGAVIRGPYLQLATPTAMTIRWRTDLPTTSRVRWGTVPGSLGAGMNDARVTTEHVVRLRNLLPNTRYYYTVGSTARILAGGADYSFVTAAPAGTARPLRIWVLGDSGSNTFSAFAVRDAYYAFSADRHTDLWLLLGDNAYFRGTDDEYQAALFEKYPEMLRQSAVWSTLGNHDGIRANSQKCSGPYYDIFTFPRTGEAGGVPSRTEAYYSFDVANVHFICLDSNGSDRSPGGPMLTWLREDLAATSQTWIIAFWHQPPYSKGDHDSDEELQLVEMRQNAVPILEEGGVDLVLCGHSHFYERTSLIDGHYGPSTTFSETHKVDGGDGREDSGGAYHKPTAGPAPHQGTVYVTCGSSSQVGTVQLQHPAMMLSYRVLGSLVLDVDRERLDLQFLGRRGDRRDYFTILKGDGDAGPVDRVALEEVSIAGTVTGSSLNTRAADGVPESLEEIDFPGNIEGTRVHDLEHKWIVDVKAGNTITFFVRAYHTLSLIRNHFQFAWSTDDSVYQNLLTVTGKEDNGTYQSASLPPTLSGRVYLRVRNTKRGAQDQALSLNTLYVDHLFIRSE